MRHVDKKTHPTDRIGARIVYREYAEARGALIDLLGEYCSFCEMQLDASLAVEHVQPKSKVSALATSWENFLLACTNCNSTKGNRHIVLGDYVWPDRDNTVLCLQYGPGALVRVAVSLTDPTIRERTQNTINLVGLDWNPSKPKTRTAASSEGRDTASDRRWRNRQEKWDIANDAKRDLDATIRESGNNSLATDRARRRLVSEAKGHGFWSIWFTVFAGDPQVRRLLIEGFPGTDLTLLSLI